MPRLLPLLGLAALLAGCGGSSPSQLSAPETALLTAIHLAGAKVAFDFKAGLPGIRARYEPRSHLAESGSGKPVPLKGEAYLIVHFQPAASAEITGETVTPTYTGPRRIEGPGPVLEIAKVSDFEADLGWAIGLDRRRPFHVSKAGSTVTVSFG